MRDIKLIVTDMDGTFLNSDYEVSPNFSAIFKELKKRNILFVPASGRQMPGITQYFAENGGYVVYKNEELFADKLDHQFIVDITAAIREIPGARAVLSAKKKAYYESDDQQFVDYFTRYYTENQKVNDLGEEVDDDVFKIAVYHPEGSEKNLYPFLEKFRENNLEVVVSGKYWLDIMNKDINKGNALEKLQNLLNISPSQTMSFGDYMNDITMLEKSKYSYAMENAHPSVKVAASFSTLSNDDFGVLKTISEYLEI
jgi:Cof subfamily protein (haloacid dehalogenase superfamily)